jgi:hypothetical protein
VKDSFNRVTGEQKEREKIMSKKGYISPAARSQGAPTPKPSASYKSPAVGSRPAEPKPMQFDAKADPPKRPELPSTAPLEPRPQSADKSKHLPDTSGCVNQPKPGGDYQ